MSGIVEAKDNNPEKNDPAPKDVNENVDEMSHEDKLQYVEREVQSLLEFCLAKGMSEKDMAKCVTTFTGEPIQTASAVKQFYATNSKFLIGLAILAVVGGIAFGWEPAYDQLSVHARLLSLQVLPYWDWSYLFNEECLINNPYRDEKKITAKDCEVCQFTSKNGVERIKNANLDDIAQNYLFEARPVIITDATKTWTGIGNFSMDNLQMLYGSHQDLQDLQECPFFSNVEDIRTVYEFFDAHKTRELTEFNSYFIFVEHCNQKASKLIRRFYGRPYFLPQSTEVSRFNQLFIAKGVENIDSEKEEEPLINQEDASGNWLAVATGKITAVLYPRNECKPFKCTNVTVTVSQGEALLVPHEIYKFKFVSATKETTIAVSSSLNWDQQ